MNSHRSNLPLPNDSAVDALINLFLTQNYDALEADLMQLLEQHPHWLIGWKILSDSYMVQHKDARIPAFNALTLNINDPQEHCYYGLVLKSQSDLAGAAQAFKQAIVLQPDYASAYNNLGIVEKDMGDIQAGIDSYRRALELIPSYASCYSNLLFCLSHAENISPQALYEEHQLFAEQYEKPLKSHWKKHTNPKGPAKVLKVGFVSAAFRDHSLANFFEPVLKHLAQSAHLSLYAYCASALEDEVTKRIKQQFSHWLNVDQWSEQAFADRVRADGIDILVDLDGHTSGNCLLAFAMKPAPIQVSWLGYLATTGLSAMDYYMADCYLLPNHQFDQQFSEKVVQLPVNATFSPSSLSPEVNALPALSNDHLTFACFNRPNKITPSAVRLWCQVLNALPHAKMLLGAMPSEGSYEGLITWFAQNGVGEERLIFHPKSDMQTYLTLHHQVDLCLDTFPSNGVTTTCHAAYMGVPTLCLNGDRLASRGAQAIMGNLGLNQFVVESVEDYINQACHLATHLDVLGQVRQSLRERFNQSDLSKPETLALSLEQVFRQMWKRWCINKSAVAINLSQVGLSVK
jgi:predicted O-linked N-acetylglucosamine transferase (SPINDLY family)